MKKEIDTGKIKAVIKEGEAGAKDEDSIHGSCDEYKCSSDEKSEGDDKPDDSDSSDE